MAGYGNRTAPDFVADDMTEQHDSTRLGLHTSHGAYSNPHEKYGSGATGGAGFGMCNIIPQTSPHTSNLCATLPSGDHMTCANILFRQATSHPPIPPSKLTTNSDLAHTQTPHRIAAATRQAADLLREPVTATKQEVMERAATRWWGR